MFFVTCTATDSEIDYNSCNKIAVCSQTNLYMILNNYSIKIQKVI